MKNKGYTFLSLTSAFSFWSMSSMYASWIVCRFTFSEKIRAGGGSVFEVFSYFYLNKRELLCCFTRWDGFRVCVARSLKLN